MYYIRDAECEAIVWSKESRQWFAWIKSPTSVTYPTFFKTVAEAEGNMPHSFSSEISRCCRAKGEHLTLPINLKLIGEGKSEGLHRGGV